MIAEDLRSLVEQLDDFLYVPDGFQRLRSVVLELAMSGRLTTPEPGDGSVDELLAEIAERRAKLGLRKIEVSGLPVQLDDAYSIPSHWRIVQLGAILLHCRNGSSASPNGMGEGYPILRISAGTSRKDGFVDMEDVKHVVVGADEAVPYVLQPGDLLACRFNGNLHYVGRVAQVPDMVHSEILHPDKLICLRAILIPHSFLRLAMNSRFVRRQIEEVAATTAGNIGINGKQLKALNIPIPPLREQERIAEKVDEALRLIDELERHHEEVELTRAAFVRSGFRQLVTGEDTVALDQMQELVRTTDDVEQIERAVLGLALRGKLVTQRSRDGDAPDLLALLALSGDGISGDIAGPWDLPSAWKWVPLAQVSESVLGKMLDKAKNKGDYRPYLRNTNVRWFDFELTDLKEMRFEDREFDRYGLVPGDVVVCEGGEPGRAAVWRHEGVDMRIQKALHRVRCSHSLRPEWLVYVLRCFAYDGILEKFFTGIGIKHLTGASLRKLPIPLPPLEEQDWGIAVLKSAYAQIDSLNHTLNSGLKV